MLKAGGLIAAAGTFGAARAHAAPREPQVVELRGTAFGIGIYDYHPLQVPPGTNRLDVKIVKNGDAKTGLGLFDQRGSHYGSLSDPNGFRGIYGEERGEFFLEAGRAQPGPRRAAGRPATGAPGLLPVAAPATVGAATLLHRLSHSELRLRAATGDSLRGLTVEVVGEVTAVAGDAFTLTRWVPGCCSAEDPLDVEVRRAGHGAVVGRWYDVQGRWVAGTGTELGRTPALLADRVTQRQTAIPRREDLG